MNLPLLGPNIVLVLVVVLVLGWTDFDDEDDDENEEESHLQPPPGSWSHCADFVARCKRVAKIAD